MSSPGPLATLILLFGGCCSNVYALEAIVKRDQDSGLLITLGQFVFVCLAALPWQIDPKSQCFIKRSPVPFSKWFWSAFMFFMVNMLNNWAFAFHISVPVHIILRSFSSAATMGAGLLRGKQYSARQVSYVAMLTVGVIISALDDAVSKGNSIRTFGVNLMDGSFEAGVVILLFAQLLSAYMGVYVQEIFEQYGKRWDENLFYTHLIGIPMFLPLRGTLMSQYTRLASSRPVALALPPSVLSALPPSAGRLLASVPESLFMLLLNSVTQLVCITGVSLLSANSSAVTVTIVLNIRKLASFWVSMWLFGNSMSEQMRFGACLVFVAGGLYCWETVVGFEKTDCSTVDEIAKERMRRRYTRRRLNHSG